MAGLGWGVVDGVMHGTHTRARGKALVAVVTVGGVVDDMEI